MQYAGLAEFSQPTIKKAFKLLEQAMLLHSVPMTSRAELPLPVVGSTRRFKVLCADIGLLLDLCGMAEPIAPTEWMALFRGAAAEQVIGQELLAAGRSIHYWARARSGTAEIDFLIRDGSMWLPCEVKSAAAGRLRSLHRFLMENPEVPRGLVFSTAPYATLPEQKLEFIPAYYAGSPALGSSWPTETHVAN